MTPSATSTADCTAEWPMRPVGSVARLNSTVPLDQSPTRHGDSQTLLIPTRWNSGHCQLPDAPALQKPLWGRPVTAINGMPFFLTQVQRTESWAQACPSEQMVLASWNTAPHIFPPCSSTTRLSTAGLMLLWFIQIVVQLFISTAYL